MLVEWGSHLRVKQDYLDMAKVRKDLLVRNRNHAAAQAFSKVELQEYVMLYEEDDEYAIVPRGYELPMLPGYEPEYIWNIPAAEHVEWPPVLRALDEGRDQINGWEALVGQLGDKMYCAGCGRGKTYMALAYAASLNVRTLVIVDRVAIGEQWVGAMCGTPDDPAGPYTKRIFDIHPDEVGWVQEHVCRIGKHLTVAIGHTLLRRMLQYPLWFWDHFGLVVVDEVHAFAGLFKELIPLFSGERLGLTATWELKSGLEAAYMMHMGGMKPCYINLEPMCSKRWIFKKMPRVVDSVSEDMCYRIIGATRKSGDSESNRVFLLNEYFRRAQEHEGWFDLICRDIAKLYEEGRTMLVLGVQLQQLQRLETWCKEQGFSVGYVDAGTKKKVRKEAYKKRVILATEKLAGKALDIQSLDTMLRMVPYSDAGRLRQESDRIGRDSDNPNEPLVIVYCHSGCQNLDGKARLMKLNVARIDKGAVIEEEVINQL